jgi:hypothetical protein
VQHRARKYGTTKFGLERFVNGFLDMLVIAFVHKFSKRPMHLFGGLGTLSFFLGMVMSLFVVGQKLYNISHGIRYRNATDNPLFYFALIAIVLGVQLFLAGFLAELYIRQSSGKTAEYQIARKIGFSETVPV